MPKTPKVKYEEMFPSEFKQALENNPTAYLAIGSLEWHGRHNVLGLDSLKAWNFRISSPAYWRNCFSAVIFRT